MSKNLMAGLAACALIAGGAGYWIGVQGQRRQEIASSVSPVQQPRAVLYYRNPMGLPDTSPTPKKDAMGMAYVPVYENEMADSGAVTIDPARLQTLGVRTAPVEIRPSLTRVIRATAIVEADERRMANVTTKAEGWIEKLDVSATGDAVRRHQVVAWIYAPDLVAAEREYLVAADLAAASHGGHGDADALLSASERRLRALDVAEEEIARLRRTGQPARRIEVRAPAAGVVLEKDVVLGSRVGAGEPLYRTADLSSVWLIAEVQEGDLAEASIGEQAVATFAAFPGRTYRGVVDFVYPVLNRETRTARVRIVLPNRDLSLRPDMYASVSIEAGAGHRGETLTVVPDSAVLDSGSQQMVLVERGAGRFVPHPVRLGARGDGVVEILEGVSPGERVVVGANFLIDAESNLRAAIETFGGDRK